jgi:hypothetical protein
MHKFHMSNRDDAQNKLSSLSRTLEALAADLDAREQRLRTLLRNIAASDNRGLHGVEGCVGHFAFVVERAKSVKLGPKS